MADVKRKSEGAAWFSVKKGTSTTVTDKIKSAADWFNQNEVRITISLGPNKERYTAFFNKFKKKETDPDLVVYKTENKGSSVSTAKPVTTDNIPF